MSEYIAIVILALALGLMNWRKNVWKQRYQIKSKYLGVIKRFGSVGFMIHDLHLDSQKDDVTIDRRLAELGKTEWPDELSEK